ncbi:hypothetical protein BC829DRAFT_59409 [Chytridium lagenaria]|nr:hypothetical protein BC829DRAFT_59409 [Chytridium lagenaria]
MLIERLDGLVQDGNVTFNGERAREGFLERVGGVRESVGRLRENVEADLGVVRGIREGVEMMEMEVRGMLDILPTIPDLYSTFYTNLQTFTSLAPKNLTAFTSTLKPLIRQHIETHRRLYESTFPCTPMARQLVTAETHLCKNVMEGVDYTWLAMLACATGVGVYVGVFGVLVGVGRGKIGVWGVRKGAPVPVMKGGKVGVDRGMDSNVELPRYIDKREVMKVFMGFIFFF